MRVKFILLAAALAAELAMVTFPAQAGVFDDEEARTRIEQLKREANARLEKLEAAQRGQIELGNQIEMLRQEIAKLRGQIEVLTHDLDQLQKRQKDFYVDLDTRLRKLEQSTVEPKPDKAAEAPKPDPQAEARDYEAALNLFKAGKYKDAAPGFENFIKAYPNSQFQANAHYWLGNALYQQKDYRRATELFHKVSTTWPNDPKSPDAMLGMANVQQDTGDTKNARLTLEAIVAKYPSSAAAELARDRLKRLKK
jgi:tol-pal system protein YbgF